jgi:hypothetical protein
VDGCAPSGLRDHREAGLRPDAGTGPRVGAGGRACPPPANYVPRIKRQAAAQLGRRGHRRLAERQAMGEGERVSRRSLAPSSARLSAGWLAAACRQTDSYGRGIDTPGRAGPPMIGLGEQQRHSRGGAYAKCAQGALDVRTPSTRQLEHAGFDREGPRRTGIRPNRSPAFSVARTLTVSLDHDRGGKAGHPPRRRPDRLGAGTATAPSLTSLQLRTPGRDRTTAAPTDATPLVTRDCSSVREALRTDHAWRRLPARARSRRELHTRGRPRPFIRRKSLARGA